MCKTVKSVKDDKFLKSVKYVKTEEIWKIRGITRIKWSKNYGINKIKKTEEGRNL